MPDIRIQKIDGQEFVPYNDYKELKERYENLIRANKKASEHVDELEEENQKLKEILNKIIKHETSMGKELFNECIKISSTNDEKKGDVSILKLLKEEGFLDDNINQNDPNGSD